VARAAQHAIGEEGQALARGAGKDLEGPGAEGALDVLHHPERLETHHPPGALGQLGQHLLHPGRVLEGGERPGEELHHPAPELRHQRAVDGIAGEEEYGKRGEARVLGQRPEQLADQRGAQVPHRQHRVGGLRPERGHCPLDVGDAAEADLGTGEGVRQRARRADIGIDRQERGLRHRGVAL
jgi:hypothetical protein